MIKNVAISLLTLAVAALGAMAIVESSRDGEQTQVRIEARRLEERARTEFSLLLRHEGELEQQITPRLRYLSDDSEDGVWKRSEWLSLPIAPADGAIDHQILDSVWIASRVYHESGLSSEGQPYTLLSTVSMNVDSIPGTRLEIRCEAGEIVVSVWWRILENERESERLAAFTESDRGVVEEHFSYPMRRLEAPRIEASGVYYGWTTESPEDFIQDLQDHLQLDNGIARIDMLHEDRRQHLQAWFSLDLVAQDHLDLLQDCGTDTDDNDE